VRKQVPDYLVDNKGALIGIHKSLMPWNLSA
jgi:hypothetical protein